MTAGTVQVSDRAMAIIDSALGYRLQASETRLKKTARPRPLNASLQQATKATETAKAEFKARQEGAMITFMCSLYEIPERGRNGLPGKMVPVRC